MRPPFLYDIIIDPIAAICLAVCSGTIHEAVIRDRKRRVPIHCRKVSTSALIYMGILSGFMIMRTDIDSIALADGVWLVEDVPRKYLAMN